MNKSVKKAIFTGSTALAILGAVFVPISGADAATFKNGYNNFGKGYNQSYSQNKNIDMYRVNKDMYSSLERDMYRPGGNIYQLERDMSRIQRDEFRLDSGYVSMVSHF